MTKERNSNIDYIRAFAILLVVLGHTITGCSKAYEESFLLDIIWSVQMPMFFIISGYINKYSSFQTSSAKFFNRLCKKTCSYLIPWFIWTFLIRGIILGQSGYFDIKYLAFHMDSGYWFLFAIWVIVILFETASFLASRITGCVNGIKYVILTVVFHAMLSSILLIPGIKFGMNFLCIKLILYYTLFFELGFMCGKLINKEVYESELKVTSCITGIALAVWVMIMSGYDLYRLDDNISGIVIRIVSSLCGCVVCSKIIYTVSKEFSPRMHSFVRWLGTHTMEIYLSHGIFLCICKSNTPPVLRSFNGFSVVALNYCLTLLLTFGTVFLLEKNAVIRKVIFWK